MRRRLALLAAVLCGSPATLAAQVVGGGALIQGYRFDDAQASGLSDFRLITLPFAAGLAAGRVAFDVSGAWARGEATGPDGAAATLEGPTDAQATLTLGVVPDRVLLRVVASVPTGRSSQSLPESVVAGVVAAELLPFAVTSWGNGGSVGGEFALAWQAGSVGLGLSGGYEAAKEFEPLAGETFAYRPGNQLRVRAALDAAVGESGTLSLVAGAHRYSEDQLGGSNLFQSGDRLEAMVSYAFAVGLRGSALVYGGVLHRAAGSLLTETPSLDGATGSPSQQLFTAGSNLALPLGGAATLLPDADLRVFRTSDGVGQGWVGTAGATLDVRVAGRRFGRRVVLAPTARLRAGHVTVRDGATYGLTGWEGGLTLRVETGR